MLDTVADQVAVPVVLMNRPLMLPAGASEATWFLGTLVLLPVVFVEAIAVEATSVAEDAQ